MRLSDLQQTMGTLLLQRAGQGILADDDAWRRYVMAHASEDLSAWPRERLRLYEELLFASVEDTARALYPFCHRFFHWCDWLELVEDFRRTHPNPSFQLYQSVKAFPAYLAGRADLLEQVPFLADLARYEWAEVELLNAANPALPEGLHADLPQALLDAEGWVPFWNPVSRLLVLEYPVPHILEAMKAFPADEPMEAGALQTDPQPVTIFLYRDPDTLKVRFFQVNPLTARLRALCEEGLAVGPLFETLASELGLPVDTVASQGAGLLNHCLGERMLLGFVPYSS